MLLKKTFLLKTTFEKNGFFNVLTYINSWNVIFSSDIKDINELTDKIKVAIANTFSLNIPVTIISPEELLNILQNAPKWWWDTNKEIIHYAIFVISPTSS